MWKRHQHACDTHRSEFRNRHRTRPADHEIGFGERGCHVIDEARHLRRHTELAVTLDQGLHVRPPCLMDHLRPMGRIGLRERLRDDLVERLRPQAAAHHQKAQRAASRQIPRPRRVDANQVGAHRVAGAYRTRQRAREGLQHPVSEPCEQPVGQPGDRVLLMHNQGVTHQRGHQSARKRHIAAHAQHHCGFDTAQGRQTLPAGSGEPRRHGERIEQALAAQAPDSYRLERDPVLRDQRCLHALRVAQPHHIPGAFAHHLCHRQARHDMPTGAACHHEQRARGHLAPRISIRFSKSTRNRIATATQLARMPLPP